MPSRPRLLSVLSLASTLVFASCGPTDAPTAPYRTPSEPQAGPSTPQRLTSTPAAYQGTWYFAAMHSRRSHATCHNGIATGTMSPHWDWCAMRLVITPRGEWRALHDTLGAGGGVLVVHNGHVYLSDSAETAEPVDPINHVTVAGGTLTIGNATTRSAYQRTELSH